MAAVATQRMSTPASMRDAFTETAAALLAEDDRATLVLAEVSKDRLTETRARYPHRVINVGIREQLMIGVAGGLALTGLRPIVHSIAPFLVERPFEQLKLDLGHQGVGAVLVSTGASYDYPAGGRTHMAPEDVALLDTLPGWTVHVPGHPDEVGAMLRSALNTDEPVYLRLSDRGNDVAHPVGEGFQVIRRGHRGLVLAVGPMLRPVMAATAAQDVTVLYANTVRPFDYVALRNAVPEGAADVAVVEPYLRGTSTDHINTALADLPHRVRALGVRRGSELRAYGTADEHEAAHGIDELGIAAELDDFLRRQ